MRRQSAHFYQLSDCPGRWSGGSQVKKPAVRKQVFPSSVGASCRYQASLGREVFARRHMKRAARRPVARSVASRPERLPLERDSFRSFRFTLSSSSHLDGAHISVLLGSSSPVVAGLLEFLDDNVHSRFHGELTFDRGFTGPHDSVPTLT